MESTRGKVAKLAAVVVEDGPEAEDGVLREAAAGTDDFMIFAAEEESGAIEDVAAIGEEDGLEDGPPTESEAK